MYVKNALLTTNSILFEGATVTISATTMLLLPLCIQPYCGYLYSNLLIAFILQPLVTADIVNTFQIKQNPVSCHI